MVYHIISVSRAVLHFRWRGHTPWPTLVLFSGLLVIFRHGVWVEGWLCFDLLPQLHR
jgi:hypothetical protein